MENNVVAEATEMKTVEDKKGYLFQLDMQSSILVIIEPCLCLCNCQIMNLILLMCLIWKWITIECFDVTMSIECLESVINPIVQDMPINNENEI